MSVASLSRVMPPPTRPVETLGSWKSVEEKIGCELPGDFKEFIELYGSGIIGRFITVLNPFSERENVNLLEQSQRQLDALRILHSEFGERTSYELFPAPRGLMPAALTDNGNVIHWLTGQRAEDWTIVVNEARGPEYEHFECNLTSFLRAASVPVFANIRTPAPEPPSRARTETWGSGCIGY